MPLNENGWEELDPTPVAKPVKFNRPGSTLDEIRAAIGILNREARDQGTETFEEADDFDVGDDFDPQTPWEIAADAAYRTPEELREMLPKPPAPPAPAEPSPLATGEQKTPDRPLPTKAE